MGVFSSICHSFLCLFMALCLAIKTAYDVFSGKQGESDCMCIYYISQLCLWYRLVQNFWQLGLSYRDSLVPSIHSGWVAYTLSCNARGVHPSLGDISETDFLKSIVSRTKELKVVYVTLQNLLWRVMSAVMVKIALWPSWAAIINTSLLYYYTPSIAIATERCFCDSVMILWKQLNRPTHFVLLTCTPSAAMTSLSNDVTIKLTY